MLDVFDYLEASYVDRHGNSAIADVQGQEKHVVG